jgi:hypothetical protein
MPLHRKRLCFRHFIHDHCRRVQFTLCFRGDALASPCDMVPRVDMRGTSFHGSFTPSRCGACGMYEDYFSNDILIDIKPIVFLRERGERGRSFP